jgi:arsenite methyltransferase
MLSFLKNSFMKTEIIKAEIKKSYGEIAKGDNSGGCCSNKSCCTNESFTSMTENYNNIEGYYKDADLSLGCGIPTEIANIKEGDTVIDLGSGAGNDVFIARKIVGGKGKVIGVDMAPEMVIRALQNNQKPGYKNVEFILGEIENMQGIASNTADVVISNCVMNLVPDKEKAFKEVHRVLKTNGHFSISDIVYSGYLPDAILEAESEGFEPPVRRVAGQQISSLPRSTTPAALLRSSKIKENLIFFVLHLIYLCYYLPEQEFAHNVN